MKKAILMIVLVIIILIPLSVFGAWDGTLPPLPEPEGNNMIYYVIIKWDNTTGLYNTHYDIVYSQKKLTIMEMENRWSLVCNDSDLVMYGADKYNPNWTKIFGPNGFSVNWTKEYLYEYSIYQANYDIGDYEQPKSWDYYIKDDANLFTDTEKEYLLEIEKKFEQNCNMQIFIKTHTTAYAAGTEVSSVFAYGNEKSPSGNGTMVLDIFKDEANKKYKICGSTSELASIQWPAVGLLYDVRKYMKYYKDFTYENLSKALNNTYNNLIFKNVSSDLFNYFDNLTEKYELKNSKLTPNGYIDDDFHLSDIRSMLLQEYVASSPPEEPPILPEPTPLPPDEQVGINPGEVDISGKLPVAPLLGALNRLKEIEQSDIPPSFKINLKQLLNAGTSNISPVSTSVIEDKDITFLDFSLLTDVKFAGVSIIQYFRTLIGALIVYFTVRYIWKSITPDSSIGG